MKLWNDNWSLIDLKLVIRLHQSVQFDKAPYVVKYVCFFVKSAVLLYILLLHDQLG